MLMRPALLLLGLSCLPGSFGRRVEGSCSAQPKPPPPVKFGVILFQAFEILDVFGPLEALNMLSRMRHLEMFLISETMDPVTSKPAMASMNPFNSTFWPTLPPTHTLETAPDDLDVLIIPGGLGIRSPNINATISYLTNTYPKLQYLITVCTGAALAARAGLLDGRRATTNKAQWNSTVAFGLNTEWVPQARWVVDGNIWTSSGISAGMDVTLAFIEEKYGKENATWVSNRMEYERHTDPDWDPFSGIFRVSNEI